MSITFKPINSMQRVLYAIEPTFEEKRATALKRMKYALQIAMYTDAHSYNLTVEAEGKLKDVITVYEQLPAPVTTIPQNIDEYYETTSPALVPDALIKHEKPFDLPPRQYRAVSVIFDITDKVKAGEYETVFNLKNEKGEVVASCSHTLTVKDVKLPDTDLVLTNWMHYDCIAQKHKVKLFGEEFYKVFASYLKVYTECGYNMLLTPLFTPPLDTKIGSERQTAQLIDVIKLKNGYDFDFSKFDKFIKFAKRNGIKYFELSHLFTQWGGNACPKIELNVGKSNQERIFGWDVPSTDIRYQDFLTAFIPKLIERLKKLGIDKCSYFHLTDEPNDKHIEKYTELREFTKALIGDMPTMDAMSHYEYYEKGLVDVPVPEIDVYKPFKENGVYPLFVYNCCNPSWGNYSNRFLSMPLHRTRIIGAQLYQTGVQGYLHWGYNFYNARLSVCEIDPYRVTDANAGFPSGDGFIVYPIKGGATHSLRSVAGFEAFDDYRILKYAEKVLGKEKVDGMLKDYGLEGYNAYAHSAQAHFDFMQKVISVL
ncbi:MAG: DUF4091 domain-containing protein [Clostridia bacterium]|nr:DUF4091 domain-containing protein [Clostridia bacterium]